jgi:hypothetical protein
MSKIFYINKYLKYTVLDIIVLNKIKIIIENFIYIKNKFKNYIVYFNNYIIEKIQKEYKSNIKKKDIPSNEKIILKLKINKLNTVYKREL